MEGGRVNWKRGDLEPLRRSCFDWKRVIWSHFVGLALIHSVRSLFASHCYCQSLQLLWPTCWLCSIQIFWHRFVFLFSTVHFYSLASLCLENELHLILKTQFLIFCWLDARLAWENQFHWAQINCLQRLWLKLLKVVVLLVRPDWLKACWDCQCGSKSDLTLADVICSNAAKSWLQSLDDSCINHQGLHVALSSSAAILMMTMVIIIITINNQSHYDDVSPPNRPSSTRVKKSPLGLSLASLNHLLSISDLVNMNMMRMVEIKMTSSMLYFTITFTLDHLAMNGDDWWLWKMTKSPLITKIYIHLYFLTLCQWRSSLLRLSSLGCFIIQSPGSESPALVIGE